MTRSTTTRLAIAAAVSILVVLTGGAIALLLQQRRLRDDENDDDENDRDVDCFDDPFKPMTEIKQQETTTNKSSKDLFRILKKGSITIVHGSMTGTCSKFAQQLHQTILAAAKTSSSNSWIQSVQVASADDFDWWDELTNNEGVDEQAEEMKQNDSNLLPPALLIVLLPTYTNGTWPPVASTLESALQDCNNDWRIAKHPLKQSLQIAVFGMGSSAYYTNAEQSNRQLFGLPAKQCLRLFQRLGAKCRGKIMIGDDAVGTHAVETFDSWHRYLLQQLEKVHGSGTAPNQKTYTTTTTTKAVENGTNGTCCSSSSTADNSAKGACCQEGAENKQQHASDCCQNNHEKSEDNKEEEYYESDDDDDDDGEEPEIMDVEDLGDAMLASSSESKTSNEPKEMVTPNQAAALKKEGYKLIGTHSAVKLCRWTKHQLRGRGGCYKHTFYGITSYQCMEATPSLACANKCVFCWRHHKNPVGKEWRWKTDDPYYIVDQAVQTHVQMIKEAKGIPGVQLDRWKEALTVRHCALSLVGEPIMYPRIDELLGELHRRKISSFLVTNGQHPAPLQSLRPVTQLYVSVDAPTKQSLIEIDRPLFNDAWERLRQSLACLKQQQPNQQEQRTVARLTVVKGWNSDDLHGYAELIALGHVSLVEIKGVTFCGKSDASNLNMTNTPWHHEVVELARSLKAELQKIRQRQIQQESADAAAADSMTILPEYDLACEHKHSCSVLLARVDQFAYDDTTVTPPRRKWRTWMDYDKFHELAMRHAADPSFVFGVKDYVADTPEWALFGSNEEGFDPTDTRHRPKQKTPKYTHFDASGVPTHDHTNKELTVQERNHLQGLMEQKKREVGAGTTVTELKGGEKQIVDASLMFRGLTITI